MSSEFVEAGMSAGSVDLVSGGVSQLPPATVFPIKYQQETTLLTLHLVYCLYEALRL